jgi:hypothetical protein
MKMRTALIALWGLVFATTNVVAAVGESIAQLIGRYGEPENGFELMLGFAEWKTKQGGKVTAILEDGKAVIMVYGSGQSGLGGVEDRAKDKLLERNLPAGEKWVYGGKAVQDFLLRIRKFNPDPEMAKMQFWETAITSPKKGIPTEEPTGKLWAFYLNKSLWIGTPQGFKKEESLAEPKTSGGF